MAVPNILTYSYREAGSATCYATYSHIHTSVRWCTFLENQVPGMGGHHTHQPHLWPPGQVLD